MKTTETTRESGAFSENARNANKLFTETSEAIMDIYKKQINTASEFYSNLFNSYAEGNRKLWNPFQMYADFFNNREMSKMIYSPFSNSNVTDNFSKIFLESLEKGFNQVTEANQNIINMLYKQIESGNADWSSFNEKYQKRTEDIFQATKGVLNSLMEASNKQIESSVETNKKFIEDVNKELNFMIRQNQKFWADMLNISVKQANEKNYSSDGDTVPVPEKRQEKVKMNA